MNYAEQADLKGAAESGKIRQFNLPGAGPYGTRLEIVRCGAILFRLAKSNEQSGGWLKQPRHLQFLSG